MGGDIFVVVALTPHGGSYEFMRPNATEEMRRVLGAKAANVQQAVPPTLAAGGDLHDGESGSATTTTNRYEWFSRART